MPDKYTKGHSYLVGRYSIVKKIKFLEVTVKCYQIQHENETASWISKSSFESEYYLIEELPYTEQAETFEGLEGLLTKCKYPTPTITETLKPLPKDWIDKYLSKIYTKDDLEKAFNESREHQIIPTDEKHSFITFKYSSFQDYFFSTNQPNI